MPNWILLDQTFRLTPWSLQEHADYVLGQYGKLITQDATKAQEYVDGYVKAEADFDQAYANQGEFLKRSCEEQGKPVQTLPDIVKIVWDPATRLAASVAAAVPVQQTVVAPTPDVTDIPVDPVVDVPVMPDTAIVDATEPATA